MDFPSRCHVCCSLDGNIHGRVALLALAKRLRLHSAMERLFASPKGTYCNLLDPKIEHEIGSGEFGSVNLIKVGPEEQAVQKISHTEQTIEENYERLVLQGLPKHENVVKLAGIWVSAKCLFLEAHQGGSLKDFAKKHKGGIPLGQFFVYITGMTLAIQHLHSHGLLHRDIAARNYVLSDDLKKVVLVDFGLSWPLEEKEDYVAIRTNEKLPWRQMPPEVMRTLTYSRAGDIWQLSLTFWQLFQKARSPFSAFMSVPQLVTYLKKKMVDEVDHIPLSFHKTGASAVLKNLTKDLVHFCSKYDPAKRPSASGVVQKIEAAMRF